jgi:aryl-alcohol dehydrogenase-like predicted oxidoreductase
LRANLAIVEQARQVARRAGATPAQVALAWALAQGRHVVPIPGTKTPAYLADNVGAADIELSAAARAELDALPAPQGARC